MVTDDFRSQVLKVLQEYLDALENVSGTPRGADFITTKESISNTVSLPGVLYNTPPVVNGTENPDAAPTAYVQIPWSVMLDALNAMNDAAVGASSVNASLNSETAVLTVTDRNGTQTSVDTAAAAKDAKTDWDENYKTEIEDKIEAADDATTAARNATDAAERVNAQLNGMTVSVTNRNGQTTSVNIGFEIAPEHVYASRAAMVADAANVLPGQFCMIATVDATDPDNATLWSRNSQLPTAETTYTFLSDLDQASSAAWADWLENQKPLIEQATTDANAAASAANTAASAANTAATNANTSRVAIEANEQTRQSNEQTRQTNEAARVAAEQTRQTSWNNWFSDTLSTGVRKIWNDWYAATTSAWNSWFGTDATSGVQKQWADLKTDAQTDHTTAQADHTTASTDHVVATGDHTTADSDHTTAGTDHTTAGTDHTRAENDHTRAEGDHTTADSDHTTAGTDHTRAEGDHSTADSDHTTAGTDHTRAEGDHSTADSDHTTAGTDHTRAEGDHSTAESDHTTAGTDHTRAEGDHGIATTDHQTAQSDHTTAQSDHSDAEEQVSIMEEWNTHQPFIGDGTGGYDENYWYIYDTTTDSYVRSVYAKGDNLDWDSMTPEEKARLLNEMMLWMEQHGFDTEPIQNSVHAVTSGGLYDKFLTKQDVISDLATIRSGAAAGATAYQLPNTGMPSTDMSQEVQDQLAKTDLKDYNDDATHRLVTDTEKTTWNAKQDALTFASVSTCQSIIDELI